MRKFRSRKELIRKYYENETREDTKRAGAMAAITYVIDGKYIASEWDYIDVYYDKQRDILFGRPVKLSSEIKKNLLDSVYWIFTDEVEKHIIDVPSSMDTLCKWMNGLRRESFLEIDFEKLEVPRFIKELEKGCLKRCTCEKSIILPTHLLKQLIPSGMIISTDCTMHLIGTGNFGECPNENSEYIEYPDLLSVNETFKVYSDKLVVNNDLLIGGFEWDKFYNSIEEMVVSLLLAKFRVFINSDVTMAILDIYSEREG